MKVCEQRSGEIRNAYNKVTTKAPATTYPKQQMSRPNSAGRPQSAHRLRQKRQVRHAVTSGADMPPIGYANRTPFFKDNGATDEKVYWSGPVGDRASPWQQQEEQNHSFSDHNSASAPILAVNVSSNNSSLSSIGRSLSAGGNMRSTPRRQRHSSTKNKRRKRPMSASPSISVLSMLEFERKASNKSRKPKQTRRPSSSNTIIQPATNSKLAESFAYNVVGNESNRNMSTGRNKAMQRKIPKKVKGNNNNTGTNTGTNTSNYTNDNNHDSSITSSLLSTNSTEEVTEPEQDIPVVDTSIVSIPKKKRRRKRKKKLKAISNLEWATAFLGRVEKRLENEQELYTEFVDSLKLSDGTLGSVRVVANAILSSHPDLMQELDDYIRRSMVVKEKNQNKTRAQSARRTRSKRLTHAQQLEVDRQLLKSTKNLSLKSTKRRRRKKHWNWILDSAKTPKPTAMKKETLRRLQKQPKQWQPGEWKRPASAYPTGRYKNVGINQVFSTAYPLTNLERTILDASRLPGPSEYQGNIPDPKMGGGVFSTANPKTDVDWIIYRSEQLPGPLDYNPVLPPTGASVGQISE